jgi:hypothetical protein
MGYVDDSCMTRFTPLQGQRMRTYLLTVGSALISPENQQARGNALQESFCEAILSPSLNLCVQLLPFYLARPQWR